MSQLAACQSPHGLVLVADRRVVVKGVGSRQDHAIRKLFPLGPAAAVATSGAAVAIAVSRTLSRLLRRRAALPFADLEHYALSVFQKEYREFSRQGAQWFAAHPEARRLSYILIGGVAPGAPGQFHFHASEEHGQDYRLLPSGQVLTAPRRLGLEARLARAVAVGTPLDDLVQLTLGGFRRIAEVDPAVAPPFDAAVLDAGGVRLVSFDR